MRLELLADAVRYDFAPIDLCACNGKLSSQRLERRVRHVLVVLGNRQLVVILGLFNQCNNLSGRADVVGGDDRIATFLGRDQLNVAILVVVNL